MAGVPASASDEQVVSIHGDLRRSAEASDFDPITTEVLRHGLNAAATQMALSLKRTAFSPVIYEVNDFACGLYDRDVRLLAQAQIFPLFLGTLHFCVESAVAAVGGEAELSPGDVIFTTYAYDIGSHQQDAAVVVPGFFDGELVGYAAVKAHHMDIGAKNPYCTDTIDIYQEGVIFPGVKVYRAGELNREMYRTILANSRYPKALAGDLHAEIGAAHVGLANMNRLLAKYGHEMFRGACERMFDHGERVIREFFSGIPDGRYTGRNAMDNNGITDAPVPIEVTLEVNGSDVVVDFTRSAPEQEGPVNCPLASTVSAARMAIMALAGGGEFVNEGHFRPIEVRARESTMYHPRPPAPVYLYYWAAVQAVDVIHRSLAESLPDLITAGSSGDICCVVWWGWDEDGRMWGDASNHPGGQGASVTGDAGPPLVHVSSAGMRNSPAEVWEVRHPMMIDCVEYAADSAGAGKFRGSLGVYQHYRALRDCYMTTTFERTKTAPWGLVGGFDGKPNRGEIVYADGKREPCTKATGKRLPAGAVLKIFIGSGGGYGGPTERDRAAVQADIRAGYLTEAEARRLYPQAFEERRDHACSN